MLAALEALLLAPLPFALVWAAASDVQRFIIPNRASLLCAAGALPALLCSGLDIGAIGLHLAVGAGALAIGFAFFALGLWGGGDGKLLAAAALWFDPAAALGFGFAVTLIGGLLGLVAVASRGYNAKIALAYGLRPITLGKWATHAPYGLAIAGGALVAFPDSALFAAYLG